MNGVTFLNLLTVGCSYPFESWEQDISLLRMLIEEPDWDETLMLSLSLKTSSFLCFNSGRPWKELTELDEHLRLS